MSYLVIAAIFLLPLAALLGPGYWRRWRRRQVWRQAFPSAWRAILKRRMPYFRALPADLQLQLKKHIQVFIAEKKFVGCAGLAIDDDMRVTIAAQACLLLLNRDTDYYPRLRRILVYPGAFVVARQHTDALGLIAEQRRVLQGESWGEGQVILSWQDTLAGAAATGDGNNVVIHEFAHQLDQEKGIANGAPILERSAHYHAWSRTFGAEFARLQQQAHHGHDSLFSHYGATDPAEFFAVASEVFFEQAPALSQQHPALYAQLSRFYRLNPLSW